MFAIEYRTTNDVNGNGRSAMLFYYDPSARGFAGKAFIAIKPAAGGWRSAATAALAQWPELGTAKEFEDAAYYSPLVRVQPAEFKRILSTALSVAYDDAVVR